MNATVQCRCIVDSQNYSLSLPDYKLHKWMQKQTKSVAYKHFSVVDLTAIKHNSFQSTQNYVQV